MIKEGTVSAIASALPWRGYVVTAASFGVLNWLLEPDNPSVRYFTLTELMDRDPDDAGVIEARRMIETAPYTAAILADYADGFVARRTGRSTALGMDLEGELDSLGVLAASLLIVVWGRMPVWFLSLTTAMAPSTTKGSSRPRPSTPLRFATMNHW